MRGLHYYGLELGRWHGDPQGCECLPLPLVCRRRDGGRDRRRYVFTYTTLLVCDVITLTCLGTAWLRTLVCLSLALGHLRDDRELCCQGHECEIDAVTK